jgi:hypothetical protein
MVIDSIFRLYRTLKDKKNHFINLCGKVLKRPSQKTGKPEEGLIKIENVPFKGKMRT